MSIAFTVDRVLLPHVRADGITFTEVPVTTPWVKDYDAIAGDETPASWSRRWDVSRWGLLVARDEHRARVGGAVLAFDTPGVGMLRGRRDLVALWDVRVHPDRRGQGIGAALWHASEAWARARGCRHLQVETQNVNVDACRFYERMGCTLGAIDRFAYWPDLADEVQLLWVKELTAR